MKHISLYCHSSGLFFQDISNNIDYTYFVKGNVGSFPHIRQKIATYIARLFNNIDFDFKLHNRNQN